MAFSQPASTAKEIAPQNTLRSNLARNVKSFAATEPLFSLGDPKTDLYLTAIARCHSGDARRHSLQSLSTDFDVLAGAGPKAGFNVVHQSDLPPPIYSRHRRPWVQHVDRVLLKSHKVTLTIFADRVSPAIAPKRLRTNACCSRTCW